MPIRTRQPRVSWLSIGLLNFVWFGEVYNALLHGVGVTFAARRLTNDTRLIVLVATMGLLFSGTIGPVINYVSDRIWTRMGRRRPFVVVAYSLSAVGLMVIPLMHTFATLAAAVACHACLHSFASPMEPLYMELVPQAQQGRSQALRNTSIQLSVLFFFQVVLVQFNDIYPDLSSGIALAGGVTGLHIAFWMGAAFLLLIALYLFLCTSETQPGTPNEAPPTFHLLRTLRSFPKEVFAKGRWWSAYGIYVGPSIAGAVWGGLQPLMLVDQFGFTMTEMARISLPVSLAGVAVIGPLVGYLSDGHPRFQIRYSGLAAVLLLGTAAATLYFLPLQPTGMPNLFAAACFTLPLGLGGVALLMTAMRAGNHDTTPANTRSRLIIISIVGQMVLAALAWSWIQYRNGQAPEMPIAVWLGYITLSQVIGLAATVTLTPLLFSRIPTSKFGTVSSGFGISSAVVSYLLGNSAGLWVHYWSEWHPADQVEYSSLWLLQVVLGVVSLVIVTRSLRAFLGSPVDSAA